MVELRNTNTDSNSNTAMAALNEHLERKKRKSKAKKEFDRRKQKNLIKDIKDQNQKIMGKLGETLMKNRGSSGGRRIIAYQEDEDTENNDNIPVIGQGEADLSNIIEEHKFNRDEEAYDEVQKSTYKLTDSDEDQESGEDDEPDENGGGPNIGVSQIVDDGLDV